MEWKCALRPLADCANSLVRAANWNVFFSVRSSRFVSSCSPSNVACDVASSCCKPLDHGDIPSFSVTSPTRRPGLMPVGAVLSALGLCSRGEGNYFLKCGLVMLDGRRLEPREAYVHPSAVLSLAPRATRMLKQHKTILLCKPMHYLTCQVDRQGRNCSTRPLSRSLLTWENYAGESLDPLSFGQHFRESPRGPAPKALKKLVAAGRLDAESTGLLVFTQDGRIAAQLVGERASLSKEYIVEVDASVSEGALSLLRFGLSLDGLELLPAKVERIEMQGVQKAHGNLVSSYTYGPHVLRFEIKEGRYRQIRRMCELVGLRALSIHRTRIGNVSLGDLAIGQWRFLREWESFS